MDHPEPIWICSSDLTLRNDLKLLMILRINPNRLWQWTELERLTDTTATEVGRTIRSAEWVSSCEQEGKFWRIQLKTELPNQDGARLITATECYRFRKNYLHTLGCVRHLIIGKKSIPVNYIVGNSGKGLQTIKEHLWHLTKVLDYDETKKEVSLKKYLLKSE